MSVEEVKNGRKKETTIEPKDAKLKSVNQTDDDEKMKQYYKDKTYLYYDII